MPKVSVIVPVYGVEKYIERCARSLFEQTLDDIEFIFVNDCTKDNSISVLEKVIFDYPLRRKQVKILHHEHNKGLSFARQTGVQNATGDYIGHCDSDDWVDKEMYERMYEEAQKGNYDYIKCGHKKTDGNKYEEIKHVWAPVQTITRKDVIRYLLQMKGWNSIWDTLARKNIYEGICYTDKAMLEDFFVTSQLIRRSKSFGIIDKPFYSYFINRDSICNVQGFEAIKRRVLQAEENLDWVLNELANDDRVFICQKDIVVTKWGVKNILVPYMMTKPYYGLWKIVYPEIDYKVWNNSNISLRNKIRFYCAAIHLVKFLKKTPFV